MINELLGWFGLIILVFNFLGQVYLDILTRSVYKNLLNDEKRRFHWKKLKFIYQNETRASVVDIARIEKIRFLDKFVVITIVILLVEYGIWVLINW